MRRRKEKSIERETDPRFLVYEVFDDFRYKDRVGNTISYPGNTIEEFSMVDEGVIGHKSITHSDAQFRPREFIYQKDVLYYINSTCFPEGLTLAFWNKFTEAQEMGGIAVRFNQIGDTGAGTALALAIKQMTATSRNMYIAYENPFDSNAAVYYNNLLSGPVNTWNHHAFVWRGGRLYYYLNGTQSLNLSLAKLDYLGFYGLLISYSCYAYLNDLLLYNGSLWTANFTPPREMYDYYKK